MSFVAALKTEIANLEAELERSLPYIRLQEARRMLALYEDDRTVSVKRQGPQYENLAEQIADFANRLATPKTSPFTSRRGSPERAKALEAARLFLVNRTGEPTTTAAIFEHVAGLGIEIGGKDPQNNLSAMLSNSPIFQSHGRSGWTLASPTQTILVDDDDEERSSTPSKHRELEGRNYDAPPPAPLFSDDD